jgi:hypothetical protein
VDACFIHDAGVDSLEVKVEELEQLASVIEAAGAAPTRSAGWKSTRVDSNQDSVERAPQRPWKVSAIPDAHH